MTFPGGKGRAYRHLVNLMPPHVTYVESHLGGGAVMRNKRPAARNFGVDVDPAVIRQWRPMARPDVTLVLADACDFLNGATLGADDLVYADPPYVMSTRRGSRIYRHEYDDSDHERLLATLDGLGCMVMVSGYRSRLYDAALARWHRRDFTNLTQAGPAAESVWLNFEPGPVLHDYRYVGDTFREREALRRRRDSFVRKVAKAPPTERNAIIAELAAAFPDALCDGSWAGGVLAATPSAPPPVGTSAVGPDHRRIATTSATHPLAPMRDAGA